MRTHHEAEEPNPGGQALDQGLREHAAGLAHLVLEGDEGLRRELQVMLMLNFKAELQLLDATSDGMSKLLKSSLLV